MLLHTKQRILIISLFIPFLFVDINISASSDGKIRDSMLVTTEWLAAHLDDPTLLLFHLGLQAGYDKEHIPGARRISIRDIIINETAEGLSHEMPSTARLDSVFKSWGINKNSKLVIYYTQDWLIPSATRAYVTFDYMGLGDRTVILDGGFPQWQAENRPVSSDPPESSMGDFSPQPTGDLFVTAEWITANLRNPGVVIVDARPEEEYIGKYEDEDLPRRGHITGAVNIPFTKITIKDTSYRFKSPDELKKLFVNNGIADNAVVVVYCGTGIWSSPVYFAAKYLGYDVRFYDGSFQEWSAEEMLPVTGPVEKKFFRNLFRKRN